ncbi:hypothetical protein [Aliikangiella coralliicola]|uniref:Lipoprotein n=1 Tax=Aliikangiella coralliicola TaxID=2592383 RepID=A0A545UG10_9GAMM|nr:hypothetical protein [Aliikangiella coralliicola]TQV88412.1 hypothetical protein FLL46_07775 [Aliikangiella coralliicola]
MRYLALLSLLLVTSCARDTSLLKQANQQKLCPAFEKPTWHPVNEPSTDPDNLISKQKFAVLPTHQTLWFEAQNNYIGLCIVPGNQDRRMTPGCATAYATYVKQGDEWKLDEQKVTICPS